MHQVIVYVLANTKSKSSFYKIYPHIWYPYWCIRAFPQVIK